MTKPEIFDVIRTNLLDVVPELGDQDVQPKHSMRDLGCNSIDRADVVLQSMEALGLTIPLYEVAGAENLQALVDFFYDRAQTDKMSYAEG